MTTPTPSALPLAEAAKSLQIGQSTLRRWAAQGCPVAHRGRGRGQRSLYSPEAIRAWRRRDPTSAIRALSETIPTLVDGCIAQAFQAASGPERRWSAAPLSHAGFLCIISILAACKAQTISELPPTINRLRNL